MPLDPQAEALLAEMREAGVKPFEELTVPEARAAAWGYLALAGEPQEVAAVRTTFIPGPTAGPPDPHLHPAGRRPARRDRLLPRQRLGHRSTSRSATRRCGRWRTRTGCVVVAVNYQKAPGAPVPGAVRRLLGRHDLGRSSTPRSSAIDPSRIAVARRQRAAATSPPPSPQGPRRGRPADRLPGARSTRPLDRGWDTPSAIENAEGYLLQRESMHWFWDHYVPDTADADDSARLAAAAATTPACRPRSSPPPSSTRCATTARRLRRRAPRRRASPVTYVERYDGMIHGFYWMLGALDARGRLHADLAEASCRCSTPVAAALAPGGGRGRLAY